MLNVEAIPNIFSFLPIARIEPHQEGKQKMRTVPKTSVSSPEHFHDKWTCRRNANVGTGRGGKNNKRVSFSCIPRHYYRSGDTNNLA